MLLCLLCTPGFSAEGLSLHLGDGSAKVRFPSVRDKQYTVEFSEDLETWKPVQDEIFGTGSEIVVTNDLEGKTRGFYRTKRSDEFTVPVSASFLSPVCIGVTTG